MHIQVKYDIERELKDRENMMRAISVYIFLKIAITTKGVVNLS